MCDFFSFVITKDGKVYCGDGKSHAGISDGWNLPRDSYREAEWVGENWNSLSVRVAEGEDKNEFLATVLALCSSKKRSDFLKLFTIGKNRYGTYYLKDGKIHREGDKPAYEGADGAKFWYKNGKLHRAGDKPAIEEENGSKAWYKNGKLHRAGDKPAYEGADGSKTWWKDGELHREGDKPAIERADGSKTWYKNGVYVK